MTNKTPATTDQPGAVHAIAAYQKQHPVKFYLAGLIGNIAAVFRKRP